MNLSTQSGDVWAEEIPGDIANAEINHPFYLSRSEYFSIISTRILFSRSYATFMALLITLSMIELIWLLHLWKAPFYKIYYPDGAGFLVLETLITLCVVVEVTLRCFWQQRVFFKRRDNLIDLAIAFLSIADFIFFLSGWHTTLGLVFTTTILIRVGFRLLRLMMIARNWQTLRDTSSLQVKFGGSHDSLDSLYEQPNSLMSLMNSLSGKFSKGIGLGSGLRTRSSSFGGLQISGSDAGSDGQNIICDRSSDGSLCSGSPATPTTAISRYPTGTISDSPGGFRASSSPMNMNNMHVINQNQTTTYGSTIL